MDLVMEKVTLLVLGLLANGAVTSRTGGSCWEMFLLSWLIVAPLWCVF